MSCRPITNHQSPITNHQSPITNTIGIPIGNLTSQFFANVYLNGMDHFIKEKLGCRYYLRYMDDFVVLHDDKDFLWSVKKAIQDYLQGLHLCLHENKCRLFATSRGAPFLGLFISAQNRRLKRANVIKFKRRLRKFQFLYREHAVEWKQINQSVQSWIGHARHADTMRLRRLILPAVVFKRSSTP